MNEDCPFCLYEKTETNCPGCWEGSNYKPKPMTNADRIRAMTDEELAEFLWDRSQGGCPPMDCDEYDGKICGAWKCWLTWLQKPVEDNT